MSVDELRASGARPVSPYKGLAAFEDSELDELLFFGREREREVIGANLVAARLTVLYGPSGVGKTSILAAAVVRDLRALPEAPLVVVHTAWADDPVQALAEAVAAAAGVEAGALGETVELACALHGELYLVLDQVEEYFVYQGATPALGDALAELTDRAELKVHVLIGIREDSLARLDAFKSRLPGLLANRVRLDHLTREAARRAIVGPVDRFAELVPEEEGLAVEPELVEAVLDGVRAGAFVPESRGRGVAPAAAQQQRVETPYLQLVMQRLWEVERAEGSRVLRLATLERLGGPRRIVEEHLERALAALTPAQKQLAARMFNHLVTPSGTKIAHGTRDLAGYAAASEEELAPVLAALGRERILRPVGGNGAQSHEIYHDVLADAVLAWRGRFDAEQALARVRRRHRRTLVVAIVALVLLALTAALAVFALAQRSQARSQRSQARAEAQRAHGRELDARALSRIAVDPQRALADAVEAAKIGPGRQAEDVLRTTLLAARLRAVLPTGGPVTTAAYSHDGKLILTASEDGKARIYDAKSRRLLRTLPAGAPLAGAVFDRAGRLVVTEGRDGAARVWDVASGRRVVVLRHRGAVLCAAFTQGGGLLVTGGADRTARIWRVGTWKPVAVLRHPGPVRGVDFDNDGSFLVTRSSDRYARLFDTRRGTLVRTLDQGGKVSVAMFGPNGKLIVTAGANETARIWVVSDGRLLHELKGHTGHVLAADIPPRGNMLATASSDGSARVWAFPEGRLLTVLIGHDNFVTGVKFSPDGFSLVTTSLDRTARVWQPGSGDLRAVLAGDTESVTGAAFSPDGTAVVTASDDGQARVWDPQIQPKLRLLLRSRAPVLGSSFLASGTRVFVVGRRAGASVHDARSGKFVRRFGTGAPLSTGASSAGRVAGASGRLVTVWDARSGRTLLRVRARTPITGVALAADGRLAAAGRRGDVELWTAGGKLERVLHVPQGPWNHVGFSPDGARLAAAGADGRARVWDSRTGRLQLTLRPQGDALTSVRFSPDGTRLVTASLDHDARIWDARSGKLVEVLRGHFAVVSDAEFSPDGRWVVTAGPTTAGLWDVRTGLLVYFLRGHEARLTSATFDPAGRRILTASVDGTVRAYLCDVCGGLDELLPLAEKRLAAAR